MREKVTHKYTDLKKKNYIFFFGFSLKLCCIVQNKLTDKKEFAKSDRKLSNYKEYQFCGKQKM